MSYNRNERIFYPTEIDKRYVELERQVSKMKSKIKRSLSIERSVGRRLGETRKGFTLSTKEDANKNDILDALDQMV